MGGKERNKHAHKKLGRKGHWKTKTIVLGAKDRASNRVTARVIPRTDARTLNGFVDSKARKGATIYTDGSSSYRSRGGVHESVSHGTGEYVRGEVHTNGIESFWAILKRGYTGVYHWMSPKHLHRYLAEFACRHNLRPLPVEERMEAVVLGMIGRRLAYRDLVG